MLQYETINYGFNVDSSCGRPSIFFLDGLDLEMEADEGEHETLEVLDQIVETAETVRVARLVHIHQGPDLARGEADVLVPDHDLQLLIGQSSVLFSDWLMMHT